MPGSSSSTTQNSQGGPGAEQADSRGTRAEASQEGNDTVNAAEKQLTGERRAKQLVAIRQMTRAAGGHLPPLSGDEADKALAAASISAKTPGENGARAFTQIGEKKYPDGVDFLHDYQRNYYDALVSAVGESAAFGYYLEGNGLTLNEAGEIVDNEQAGQPSNEQVTGASRPLDLTPIYIAVRSTAENNHGTQLNPDQHDQLIANFEALAANGINVIPSADPQSSETQGMQQAIDASARMDSIRNIPETDADYMQALSIITNPDSNQSTQDLNNALDEAQRNQLAQEMARFAEMLPLDPNTEDYQQIEARTLALFLKRKRGPDDAKPYETTQAEIDPSLVHVYTQMQTEVNSLLHNPSAEMRNTYITANYNEAGNVDPNADLNTQLRAIQQRRNQLAALSKPKPVESDEQLNIQTPPIDEQTARIAETNRATELKAEQLRLDLLREVGKGKNYEAAVNLMIAAKDSEAIDKELQLFKNAELNVDDETRRNLTIASVQQEILQQARFVNALNNGVDKVTDDQFLTDEERKKLTPDEQKARIALLRKELTDRVTLTQKYDKMYAANSELSTVHGKERNHLSKNEGRYLDQLHAVLGYLNEKNSGALRAGISSASERKYYTDQRLQKAQNQLGLSYELMAKFNQLKDDPDLQSAIKHAGVKAGWGMMGGGGASALFIFLYEYLIAGKNQMMGGGQGGM